MDFFPYAGVLSGASIVRLYTTVKAGSCHLTRGVGVCARVRRHLGKQKSGCYLKVEGFSHRFSSNIEGCCLSTLIELEILEGERLFFRFKNQLWNAAWQDHLKAAPGTCRKSRLTACR